MRLSPLPLLLPAARAAAAAGAPAARASGRPSILLALLIILTITAAAAATPCFAFVVLLRATRYAGCHKQAHASAEAHTQCSRHKRLHGKKEGPPGRGRLR